MSQEKFQNINIYTPPQNFIESSIQGNEFFEWITNTLSESLDINIIVFNKDLKISYFTPHTAFWLILCDTVDKTLSAGTDEKVWKNWTDIFQNILRADKKTEFQDVRYKKEEIEHHLFLTCIPFVQSSLDTASGGILIIQNTSDRSSVENRSAHAERFITLGKVAGRVAHELNNPLDGILRYINLSIRVLEDGQVEKTQEYLQQCRTGLRRMIQVLSELLEFSRSTHLTFEKLPTDRLLSDALKNLDHVLKGIEVTIHRNYKGPAPTVRTDSMFQVFCNLIKNAADAMNGTGSLTISISQSGSLWNISFQDTGPGFDPAAAEHLFQPFYTTKLPGRGTGLGLAICKDILGKYGGTISAVNAPEGGSIFTITLPVRENLNPSEKESIHE